MKRLLTTLAILGLIVIACQEEVTGPPRTPTGDAVLDSSVCPFPDADSLPAHPACFYCHDQGGNQ